MGISFEVMRSTAEAWTPRSVSGDHACVAVCLVRALETLFLSFPEKGTLAFLAHAWGRSF